MVSRHPRERHYGAELAGDYHNGPLSVIIPFGVFGVIAFVWFLLRASKGLVGRTIYTAIPLFPTSTAFY